MKDRDALLKQIVEKQIKLVKAFQLVGRDGLVISKGGEGVEKNARDYILAICVKTAEYEIWLKDKKTIPDADMEFVIFCVVKTLFVGDTCPDKGSYEDFINMVCENYRLKKLDSLRGLQTPRTFDEDNVQTKGSESKPTIGAEVESVKNSKQVKSVFNALNKKLNSLISRGDS